LPQDTIGKKEMRPKSGQIVRKFSRGLHRSKGVAGIFTVDEGLESLFKGEGEGRGGQSWLKPGTPKREKRKRKTNRHLAHNNPREKRRKRQRRAEGR